MAPRATTSKCGGRRPKKARELGNLNPGYGLRFHERGYVQLTGCVKFTRMERKFGKILRAATAPQTERLIGHLPPDHVLWHGGRHVHRQKIRRLFCRRARTG